MSVKLEWVLVGGGGSWRVLIHGRLPPPGDGITSDKALVNKNYRTMANV